MRRGVVIGLAPPLALALGPQKTIQYKLVGLLHPKYVRQCPFSRLMYLDTPIVPRKQLASRFHSLRHAHTRAPLGPRMLG